MTTINAEWHEYIKLINREVVPALGCTEPVCVALAAAHAARALGRKPEQIKVHVSANLYKNGMGVTVPGTEGMLGLEAAAAVGALGGVPELGLEALRDITPQHVLSAKKLLNEKKVTVSIRDTEELIYSEIEVRAETETARCIIAKEHTVVVIIERNGKEIFKDPHTHEIQQVQNWPLTVSSICDFANNAPFSMIEFILESARLNEKVAEKGLLENWGLGVGRSMEEDIIHGLRADDINSFAIKMAAAASDARMAGITEPVMSNSGSGNQGIAATLPVLAFAKRLKVDDEQLARALVMSHLTAIHLKHYLGRLSALCGAIVAASGSACGIVILLGGGKTEIEHTIRNMVGSIAGMICDGAKSSCALKVATSVESGINAAYLAMKGTSVPGWQGILDDDIEVCIKNLGQLGSAGMSETDKIILGIMTSKHELDA